MASETWRVVLRDGSVLEVAVDRMGRLPVTASWDNYRCDGSDPWDAISKMFSATFGVHVTEILAPGEPTRAEAVAAERERCARACDSVAQWEAAEGRGDGGNGARVCAAKIRAGGV